MNEEELPRTRVEELNRQQLEIYAKELRESLKKEKELRAELENRVRELMALNNLFQQHLKQRFDVIDAYKELVEQLENFSRQMNHLIEKAHSRLPVIEPSGRDLLKKARE